MRLTVTLALAGLAVLCAAAPTSAAEWQTRSVLVIEADRPELPLYVAANDAFRATVRDASRQPVEVFLESLDLERFSQEGYLEEYERWVGVKYGGRRIDAVVALGPVAYRIAVRWRDRLWPGVPLVFGAVDHGTFEGFGRVPGSTGALIEFGHLDSIRMALELFPETRHLAIVSGPPDRDGHARHFNSEIISAFAGRLEIIQLAGLSLTEIVDRAGQLPDRSIIIITSFSVDGTGRVFTGQEGCALLAARANAPIFGIFRSYFGSGIVGGVLLDPVIVGRDTGALVARVLNGEPAASIAIRKTDVNIKAFDWRRLGQWGIPERRLPPGSLVEFQPPSLWQEYRVEIIATAGTILLLIGLVGALLVERRHSREANRGLQRLSGRILTAQEDERRRVARELHDDISQRLALLAIENDAASMRVDGGPERRAAGASPKLHALAADVHAIAQHLHPSRLESLGLPATLRAFCEDVGKRHGVRVVSRSIEPQIEVPADIALSLFRVAQEAVQNAVKHGGARGIDVELSSDRIGLTLTVVDDGRGFAAGSAERGGGLGIPGMRERLRLVGGRLQIDSRSGAGTTVVARVPLPQERDVG